MRHSYASWTTLRRGTARGVQSGPVVVCAGSHPVRNRIVACLRDLAIDHRLVDQERLETAGQAGILFIVDTGVVERVTRCPPRTIVVFTESLCALSVLHHLAAGHVVPVRYDDLDHERMSRAIIRCVATNGVSGLAAHLASQGAFSGVPERILRAFVLHPKCLRTLRDVCRVLAVSPSAARALVREAGFRRSEHLFAALRAESWAWFHRQGFRSAVFECYLGIWDRSDFRRACRRAALPLPWNRVG
jgi:hypothetical protein